MGSSSVTSGVNSACVFPVPALGISTETTEEEKTVAGLSCDVQEEGAAGPAAGKHPVPERPPSPTPGRELTPTRARSPAVSSAACRPSGMLHALHCPPGLSRESSDV